MTCVAVFDLLPLPKLALVVDLPPGYTGPPINLTARSNNETCVEAPAAQLGVNGTTLAQPGAGLCRGNGTMPPGTYQLEQPNSPPGLEFDSFICWDVEGNNVTLRGRDVETVILQRDEVVTCSAKFLPLPKLALQSRFPDNYRGPSECIDPLNSCCGRVALNTGCPVIISRVLCRAVLCCVVLILDALSTQLHVQIVQLHLEDASAALNARCAHRVSCALSILLVVRMC
jgi:hypothetical protein